MIDVLVRQLTDFLFLSRAVPKCGLALRQDRVDHVFGDFDFARSEQRIRGDRLEMPQLNVMAGTLPLGREYARPVGRGPALRFAEISLALGLGRFRADGRYFLLCTSKAAAANALVYGRPCSAPFANVLEILREGKPPSSSPFALAFSTAWSIASSR